MISATIDGVAVRLPKGMSILHAARSLGIQIPTLCHLDGYPHTTSCLVCVVEESRSGRLLPSCSAPLEDGMEIRTANDRVRAARKSVLDLLLSEHVGDCEAPCQRVCPAHLDVPRMIRQIGDGTLDLAIATIKETIPLPAVLGRICSAPCEKGCRRATQDRGISICLLRRHVADWDLAAPRPYLPPRAPRRGVRIAVVGAGPAGLTAAWYLALDGFDCTVLDDRPEPGGMLRYGVPEEKLERSVLDREIALIRAIGVEFRQGTRVGEALPLDGLLGEYAAIALTAGAGDRDALRALGLETDAGGVRVDPLTRQTSHPRIFAGGDLVRLSRMAVRAVGDGRTIAASIAQLIDGRPLTGAPSRFQSMMGRLRPGEIDQLMQGINPRPRVEPVDPVAIGLSDDEARAETTRCMGCDCRKIRSCQLRRFADEYAGDASRFRASERGPFQLDLAHPRVAFEPGKCIKCGLCIQIAERHGEPVGLSFLGRGYDVRLGTAFHQTLAAGLQRAAEECARACPTAALSLRLAREDRDAAAPSPQNP